MSPYLFTSFVGVQGAEPPGRFLVACGKIRFRRPAAGRAGTPSSGAWRRFRFRACLFHPMIET